MYARSRSLATRCAGGDPSKCDDPEAWLDTISHNPVLLSYTMYPISGLIPDADIKTSMEQAVTPTLTLTHWP